MTSLTIHNKPVILASLICEKYLMSNCLFFVGNNLFNHSSSVQRLFWRCMYDVFNVYLFLVKSRGAEEPNETFANINKFNLYRLVLVLRWPMFFIIQKHTKQSWPELKLYAASCSDLVFVFDVRLCAFMWNLLKH